MPWYTDRMSGCVRKITIMVIESNAADNGYDICFKVRPEVSSVGDCVVGSGSMLRTFKVVRLYKTSCLCQFGIKGSKPIILRPTTRQSPTSASSPPSPHLLQDEVRTAAVSNRESRASNGRLWLLSRHPLRERPQPISRHVASLRVNSEGVNAIAHLSSWCPFS
jgi:hypothetical protein